MSSATEALLRATQDYWSSFGTALAGLFFGGQAHYAPESFDPPYYAGSGAPSNETPQPLSPGPLAGGSLTPSSGGGTGGGSGVAPALLLLCFLVSAAILLRRDGRLSWILFLLPKLRSTLRPALERPG